MSAQALAMQSCSVAIHYHSPGSKLAAGTTKNAISSHGGDAEVFQADLTKVSTINRSDIGSLNVSCYPVSPRTVDCS